MLSRTADNLYWVSRYVERAEFIARVLDATQRLSTLPAAYGGVGNEWRTALLTVGASEAYDESFTEVNERNVTTFLALSLIHI